MSALIGTVTVMVLMLVVILLLVEAMKRPWSEIGGGGNLKKWKMALVDPVYVSMWLVMIAIVMVMCTAIAPKAFNTDAEVEVTQ